jgi:hypothetical protein
MGKKDKLWMKASGTIVVILYIVLVRMFYLYFSQVKRPREGTEGGTQHKDASGCCVVDCVVCCSVSVLLRVMKLLVS